MSDEINLQKNLYQGNYDNEYKASIKASSDSSFLTDSSKKEPLIEAPKYMNLGAPRDRYEDDLSHHKTNMNNLLGKSPEGDLSSLGLSPIKREEFSVLPKKTGKVGAFFARYLNLHMRGPHFKMVKTDTVGPHSVSTKIKWGVVSVLVGVSVASFLTQSVLFLKDYFFNKTPIVANSTEINNLPINEFKGSDDGTNANGSSTGQKIGPAPSYRLNDVDHFPALSAKSFLVADLETGETIKESQDVKPYPLASVSKLMTGLIVAQEMDPKSMAIVSRRSYNTFGTEGELLLGESIRVSDLMYPLLMESSNDAAEVLADSYGNDKFMAEMNRKAKELGMNDTYYNDPSGLDPKNISTVDDQFKLAKYIYEKNPVVFDLTRVRQFEILNHRWYSKNAMLNMDSFLGGKNGFIDESRQTTTCLFDVQMAKGGYRKIAIMLLRTNDREGDVVKIIKFLQKNGYYDVSLNK